MKRSTDIELTRETQIIRTFLELAFDLDTLITDPSAPRRIPAVES